MKIFLLAKANCQENTKYVVTSRDKQAEAGHPSLILYQQGTPTLFDPPSKLDTPTAEATEDSIELKWTAPNEGKVAYYQVVCQATDDSSGQCNQSIDTRFTVTGLYGGIEYECHILAVEEHGFAIKSTTCRITTKSASASLAHSFLKHPECTAIMPLANPSIHQLPLTLKHEDKENKLRKYEICLPNTRMDEYHKPEKVLMLVGATGAGKTTLLNAMANYILGVNWEDKFRFKMIHDEGTVSEAYSQTKYISAYSFYSTNLDFNLTVVDTPGFGDTGGLENDRDIVAKQIKNFFAGEDHICSIDQIHGIGFVTQASLARLTAAQKHIFNVILGIYGKDIEQNIFLMTTFADAKKPPVLVAAKEAKVPYENYFKFNNSALYDSSDPVFNSSFWKMCYESFKEFFEHFSRVEAKSLYFTREVLKEREQLQTLIPQLKYQVRMGMAKMEEIKQEEAILKQHEAEINANKNFEVTIDVVKFKNCKLDGAYCTTCNKCNFTCHIGCLEEDVKHCTMMAKDKCTACPNGCRWSEHVQAPYLITFYTEKETQTLDDLKKKYDTAKSGKERAESMIAENEDHLAKLHAEVHLLIQRTHASIERLKEIALKPNPMTELEYLDLLIQSEQQEAKPGWQKRVEKYQDFRKDAELYKKVAERGVASVDVITAEIDHERPRVKKRIQEYIKQKKKDVKAFFCKSEKQTIAT